MKINFSKNFNRILYWGCWAAILLVSYVYVVSSSTPWDRNILNIEIPKIDPLVHLDTKFYVLPQKMFGNRLGMPPNEYLIEKSRNFYSGAGTEYYTQAFYRPDFHQFPAETLLILFFRIATFAGIVIFLFLLSQIIKTILQRNPFDESNYLRLFYMGLIFLILPLFRVLHSVVLTGFLRYDTKLLGYELSPSYLGFWLISIGILLLILSTLFKETSRIYEEQKLTV